MYTISRETEPFISIYQGIVQQVLLVITDRMECSRFHVMFGPKIADFGTLIYATKLDLLIVLHNTH